MKDKLFWGYVNEKGYLTVSEYIDDRTMDEFMKLPFIKKIFRPIQAHDLADARRIIEMNLRELS